MEIRCPITDEVILKMTPKGLVQRVNYTEVWFNLSDGSRMRIPMSKNAVKFLKEKETDNLFKKIQEIRTNKIKGKVLPKKIKDKQLARISKLSYKEVEDRNKSLIRKK